MHRLTPSGERLEAGDLEWRITDQPVDYPAAVAAMEHRAARIRSGAEPELVWLLEHPPLYTAGTSARPEDLLSPDRFPVYRSGRGGQFTYHGPGQRVAYVMLDLQRRRKDVRCYVHSLEEWLIITLAHFNVTGLRRQGRVGLWVDRSDRGALWREHKIAAIGVRIRRWVTMHGIALNVSPDLEHFSGIVACGIAGYGVTSLEDLGQTVSMPEVDTALKSAFPACFGAAAVMGPQVS